MSKAKFALIFVMVIGIIGLLAAFKVSRFSSHFIYTGKLNTGVCTTKVKGAAIMNGTPNAAASTIQKTKDCPNAFTVTISD
jgi:hypothetical protein